MTSQNTPLVSCITPTYGRFPFLQEMYWCWLNQTYQNKELIIVNDEPNLEIVCDNPNVKVFNILERFCGLGSKRNFCIQQCSPDAEYILPFDDDDLTFPNHISSLVAQFPNDGKTHRTKNKHHYMTNDNIFVRTLGEHSPFFGASCFSANFLRSIEFDETRNVGEDTYMMEINNIKTFMISNTKPNYIYRRGMGVVHCSENRDITEDAVGQVKLFNKIANSVNINSGHTIKTLQPHLRNATKDSYNELSKMSGYDPIA